MRLLPCVSPALSPWPTDTYWICTLKAANLFGGIGVFLSSLINKISEPLKFFFFFSQVWYLFLIKLLKLLKFFLLILRLVNMSHRFIMNFLNLRLQFNVLLLQLIHCSISSIVLVTQFLQYWFCLSHLSFKSIYLFS